MSKQRVLVLCERAPWLHEAGMSSRSFTTISALARVFAVDVVTREPDETVVPAAFARSIDSYAALRYTGSRGERELREFVADRLGRFAYAAIHVDRAMSVALPKRDVIPIVYDARPALHVAPTALEALLVRLTERRVLARAALVFVSNDAELERVAALHPAAARNAVLVPDAVDAGAFADLPAPPPVPTVLVSAGPERRSHDPGIKWFLRNVLPALRERTPDVRLMLDVDGVPFARLLGASSALAIVPGAQATCAPRILGAWWSMRPVVSTRSGAAALAYDRNRDLFVTDDAALFAQRLGAVLTDHGLAMQVARVALRRARRTDAQRTAETILAGYGRFAPAPSLRIPTVSEEFAVASRS